MSFGSTQPATQPNIIIHNHMGGGLWGRFRSWFLYMVLIISLLANIGMYSQYEEYYAADEGPTEAYHSGDKEAKSKIARISVEGTIMPPFTSNVVQDLKKAAKDEAVKGVLLVIDSPGGLVSDSHEIYHELIELRKIKPIVVHMKSMAASGGYYVAMGAGKEGKIFAEPITWTGSIGVIIPHYDVSKLATDFGVKVEPLKTGEFKDALSPFKELTPAERKLWEDIMNQSFEEFLTIIDENRDTLDLPAVKQLATGQIYTAKDAKRLGMIDEIGYEEDALAALKKQVSLTEARVVKYKHAPTVMDLLSGSASARDPQSQWRALLESTVPRAMYYCSWGVFPSSRR